MSATYTPSQRARIAALTRWANEDPAANAQRGQAGLRAKFYNQTDPTLPEAERQRRADCAYRLHFVRLQAKRKKRSGGPRRTRNITVPVGDDTPGAA